MRFANWGAAAVAVVVLSACGGGGGSESPAAVPENAASSPATPTIPTTPTNPTPPVEPQNSAPTARAGQNQSLILGATATLNGQSSSDPEGDTLTYLWSIESAPAGSTAALSASSTASVEFAPDRAGQYTLALVVNDGKVSSEKALVTVTAAVANTPPVAVGGPQTLNSILTQNVFLDGTASYDPDAPFTVLTYKWSVVSKPAGSILSLDGPWGSGPNITPDRAGVYVFSLVVSDGVDVSAPYNVTLTVSDNDGRPVANAGPDIFGSPGTAIAPGKVVLDGSASFDPTRELLTYAWSLTTKPAGSTAVMLNATGRIAEFFSDMPGVYVASLVVNDGTNSSDADTVVIQLRNSIPNPVANAGADQSIAFRSSAQLDGSASHDPEGRQVTYAWSVIDKPAGSAPVIVSNMGVQGPRPTFMPDVVGDYTLRLTISASGPFGLASATDDVVIQVR